MPEKVEEKVEELFPKRNHKTFDSPTGDKTRKVYQWEDPNTCAQLVEVGEIDIQKEIDAAAVGSGTAATIARILAGDLSGFADGEPVYDDVSGVPDTYAETLKLKEEYDRKVEALKAKAAEEAKAEEAKAKEIAAKEEALKAEFEAYKKAKAELEAAKGV